MGDYKKLFVEPSTFNANSIVLIKPIGFNKSCKNMGVYYKKCKDDNLSDDSEDPIDNISKNTGSKFVKQKIIFKTPKMLVPFEIKEFVKEDRKNSFISLSFGTLTNLYNEDEIKIFYHTIRKIDNAIEGMINDNKKAWGLPKTIKYKRTLQKLSADYPCHMNACLPFDNKYGNLFNTYDESGKKADTTIIVKRSVVSVILELTDIWFSEKECRANWSIMQIRKHKPYAPLRDFFMKECFIVDLDDPDDIVQKKLAEKEAPVRSHNPYLQAAIAQQLSLNNESSIIPPPSNAPTPPPLPKQNSTSIGTFTPSLGELLNAKSTLKKITVSEKKQPVSDLVMSNYATDSISNSKSKESQEPKIITENSEEYPDEITEVESPKIVIPVIKGTIKKKVVKKVVKKVTKPRQ